MRGCRCRNRAASHSFPNSLDFKGSAAAPFRWRGYFLVRRLFGDPLPRQCGCSSFVSSAFCCPVELGDLWRWVGLVLLPSVLAPTVLPPFAPAFVAPLLFPRVCVVSGAAASIAAKARANKSNFAIKAIPRPRVVLLAATPLAYDQWFAIVPCHSRRAGAVVKVEPVYLRLHLFGCRCLYLFACEEGSVPRPCLSQVAVGSCLRVFGLRRHGR